MKSERIGNGSSPESRAQHEADLLQETLRDAIESMHQARGKTELVERASMVCAHLHLSPRGYHAEIELVPAQQRHLEAISKFKTQAELRTAVRHYIVVEKPLGDSSLSLCLGTANGNFSFILREIKGKEIGFERRFNAVDLSSARIVPDQFSPTLIEAPSPS